MLDFVLKNKEWLFSGAGIAVITLIIYLFRTFRSRRTSLNERPPSIAIGQPLSVVLQMPQPPIPEPAGLHNNLTVRKIMTTIREAPLLQQADVANKCRNIHVTWRGKLASARRSEQGKVRIGITVEDGADFVFFEVDEASYPGLGLLKGGEELTVEGDIEAVQTKWIDLINARMYKSN